MSRRRDERFYQRTNHNRMRQKSSQIEVEPTGAQQSRDHALKHHLEGFRNNLAGLSYKHNLLFIASSDKIHVYEPKFPDQTISANPVAILGLPRSAPNLRGFIPGDAHAINHLQVSALGEEEIVVCACNDGDILAYWTKDINQESERVHQFPNLYTNHAIHLRPFFHQNVGESAWGLDVHKEARMIAVSCNTHDVTVFAFALQQKSHVPSPSATKAKVDPHAFKQTYLSADTLKHFDGPATTSRVPGRSQSSSENSFESGAAYASSQRSDDHHSEFRNSVATDWLEKSKWDPPLELFHQRNKNFRISLEHHRQNIPSVSFCNSSQNPNGRYLISTDIAGHTVLWDVELAQLIDSIKGPRDPFDEAPGLGEYPGWGVLWIDKRMFRRTRSVTEALGKRAYVFRDLTQSLIDIPNVEGMRNRTLRSLPVSPSRPAIEQKFDDDDVDSESTEDFRSTEQVLMPLKDYWPPFAFNERRRWSRKSALAAEATGTMPSNPCLILSVQTLQLFQSEQHFSTNSKEPLICMFDPLRNRVDEGIADLIGLDRLNLYEQIPELGVVLIGSAIGRVAVLTCHALEPNPICTEPNATVVCTLRLHCVIPFMSQLNAIERPAVQLVGLAASPVQGRQGDRIDRPRKWRILLIYQDWTTLAYEIWNDERHTNTDVLII